MSHPDLHQERLQEAAKSPSPVHYLPKTKAYDLWSTIYAIDGNFFQALDSIEMKTLFPKFLLHIQSPRPWRAVDLRCGTGRNTIAHLSLPAAEVIGLDPPQNTAHCRDSRQRGSDRISSVTLPGYANSTRFELFDLLNGLSPPESPTNADAIISTLVLEQISIRTFFATTICIIKPGGVFLVTNMRSEIGDSAKQDLSIRRRVRKLGPRATRTVWRMWWRRQASEGLR